MNKKVMTLMIITSAISLSAQADTTVLQHYCAQDGVKFTESVRVGSGQRVYVGYGGKTQVVGKGSIRESDQMIKKIDSSIDADAVSECQDFLLRRYQQDPVARVTFEFNQDRLTSSAKYVLDGLGNESATYNIVGNTDSVGSNQYNLDLGGARAHEVAQYLEEKGLPYGSERVISLGELNPVALNTTAEGRAINRRVDITVAK